MKTTSFLLLLFISFVGWSQQKNTKAPVKHLLTHSVYDSWKEIPYKSISPDGSYAATIINPQDGDGKVVIYNLKRNVQDSIKRAAEFNFSFDSQYAVFKIKPEKQKVKDLRRQKKKKEDLPKDSLGIFSLLERKVEKISNIRSYKMPEKAGGWVAYMHEASKEEKSSAKPDTAKSKVLKPKKVKKNSDENGYTLTLHNVQSKQKVTFGYIKDYTFAKFGQGLLFTTTGNDSTLKPGVYWYDLKNNQPTLLLAGHKKYTYKGLSISEDGTQVAFLADTDTTKKQIKSFQLFHWQKDKPSAVAVAAEKSNGIPADYLISENNTPTFSKDGSILFFGVAPKPLLQDTTKLDEEIVKVEVWNWKDSVLYTQQNAQLENEKKRSYQAVFHSGENKIVTLASPAIPIVVQGAEGNANMALGISDKPYRWSDFYDISGHNDAYLIDVKTGASTLIAQKVKGNFSLSPQAKFTFWFSAKDTSWFAYDNLQGKTVNLTQSLPVKFADEEDDHPDYPGAYGFAGWLENDEGVLLYDRYDIWLVDPTQKRKAINLTNIGRKEKIVFRYIHLDPEEKFISSKKNLLLSAFNETNKSAGYYQLNVASNTVKKLMGGDYRFASVQKANLADNILFTRENFTEFPDVWTSNLQFQNPVKLSNANPQQKNYVWGNVSLVNWVSLDNVPLQGLLYKPENFDPKKKYPMIVYFYEKESENLHRHVSPSPTRASINYTVYTSSGYLVFVPDIVYKIGYPGESAHNCILPGVSSLIAQGFVDEKRIGIQGHSWGGYQTAYLITKTNMFAAAEAGAPVVNMISAYGGIRWESGYSRMFQYEHSQSRLGGTLWEKPLLYLENSPIFFADKIKTPLLMMHNDADGAVPWYQGIEYYMALRRLQKPVWMLNYNGQGHGLSQRQDRTDFTIRLKQFFDHYLQNAPMPVWMKEGVPAIRKGILSGY
ncbi:MAG: prolyl oligopeptidase family serine peptidase [Cyclobacteriaceae bacterium]|nr:prolyl oligopeptidase family serine peptidase [Cytophagales bacterium]MCZ8328916.1 prolyl oligopeptidase family serine peptidase [Cyclobacteriaceae bacterium]